MVSADDVSSQNLDGPSLHSPARKKIALDPDSPGMMGNGYSPVSHTGVEGETSSTSTSESKLQHIERLQSILKSRRKLPIFNVRRKLLDELSSSDTVIIIGETGCGKTTQIPQFIHEERWDKAGGICITQPRRVAAISVAKRVSEEMDTNLGGLVGYSVRFEEAVSHATKIKYVTDGMLLRESILDPHLSKYRWVILDEAHERTISTDVLFGIVKSAQKYRKENNLEVLNIIVMSATMDADDFSKYFNNAKVIYLEGRQFPIETFYAREKQEDYVLACMSTVFQIHRQAPACDDILVFMTGQDEIESVVRTIRQIGKDPSLSDYPRLRVFPLYAALPAHQQLTAFRETAPGERKVIVSTNIAETSVTIPGIKYVVDSGRAKVRTYNALSGFDDLKVKKISQAQAWQRTGRAGRVSDGYCYRAYTLEEFEAMRLNPVPEILQSNLANVLLQLLAIGIRDVLNFDFIDKPSHDSLKASLETLSILDAVHEKSGEYELTAVGKTMSQFPLEPSFSKIILNGPQYSCTSEVLIIVSILSSESIFVNPVSKREEISDIRRKFSTPEGDHIMFLNIFRAFKALKEKKVWCRENFLNHRNLTYAMEVQKQLLQVCHKNEIAISTSGSTDNILRCLITGIFTNVAELQPNGKYIILETKEEATIHPTSALFGSRPEYILFTKLLHTGKTYMQYNSRIDAQWLFDFAPDYFRKKHLRPAF